MGELASGETEAGLEVTQQDLPLWVRFDGLEHLLVDCDLVGLAGGRRFVSLLLLGENVTLSLLSASLSLPAEIGIVNIGRDLDLAHVQLCAGCNDEVLVDTANRYAVNFVGS